MGAMRPIIAVMPTGEAELALEATPATPSVGARAIVWPMLGRLADVLLPPVCIACRARIGSHGLLCGACFDRIAFIAPHVCARLGVPLPYGAGEGALSAAAIATLPVYDWARAAARYSKTMRELIQSFKYRDRQARRASPCSPAGSSKPAGLSADQRRRNVAGAFKVDKAHAATVRGKRVVVI